MGYAPFKELTTPTESTLEAEIDPEGADVRYHFEYGRTTSYGTNGPAPNGDAGSGCGSVHVAVKIASLAPQTTYHERLVAEYAGVAHDGPDYAFTTGPWEPELESFVAVAGVRPTEITLRGAVNPGYDLTAAHFEYGETSALGSDSPAIELEAVNKLVPVEYTIRGLIPSSHYYFRLEAANNVGIVHGLMFVCETT